MQSKNQTERYRSRSAYSKTGKVSYKKNRKKTSRACVCILGNIESDIASDSRVCAVSLPFLIRKDGPKCCVDLAYDWILTQHVQMLD